MARGTARLTWIFILISFLCLGANKPKNIDNMPLVQSHNVSLGDPPKIQRGPEYRKYLSAGVLVINGEIKGSGTIVYYDKEKNIAYIASCGHIWTGASTTRPCYIKVWYHNEIKLKEPETHKAQVLFYDNTYDTSLISFSPNWEPNYFPIAPINYNIFPGSLQHSIGCEFAEEVAHYEVEVVGYGRQKEREQKELITIKNSPRQGRSGGGLLTTDGYYIGTCWGTSNYDGTGEGYFTVLDSIHKVWTKHGYSFLLSNPLPIFAQKMQVIDRNQKQGQYKENYILIPN